MLCHGAHARRPPEVSEKFRSPIQSGFWFALNRADSPPIRAFAVRRAGYSQRYSLSGRRWPKIALTDRGRSGVSMGWTRIRALTAGFLLCSLVTVAIPTAAGASPQRTATVANGSSVGSPPSPAPLPATLPDGTPGSAQLNSTSCSSVSFCVAVGMVSVGDGGGDPVYPLVETYSGGTWTSSIAPEPANSAEGGAGLLNSVSCPTDGNCAAVGDMFDSRAQGIGQDGLLETLSGGVWTGSEAALPADLTPTPVNIHAVSCGGTGSCVAVGEITGLGLIWTLSSGAWTVQGAPLPSDGNSGDTIVASVSCADSSDCLAVGTYANSISIYEPLVLTLASGTWTPSQSPLPTNAATTRDSGEPYPGGQLNAVDCPLSTYCVAGGWYTTSDYSQMPLLVTFQSGTATPTEGPVPADAQTDSRGAAQVNGISCTGVDECVAVGTYWISFDTDENGMILTQQPDGTWTVSEVPPTMAVKHSAVAAKKRARQTMTSLQGVSCTSRSFCRAVGSSGNSAIIEKIKRSVHRR